MIDASATFVFPSKTITTSRIKKCNRTERACSDLGHHAQSVCALVIEFDGELFEQLASIDRDAKVEINVNGARFFTGEIPPTWEVTDNGATGATRPDTEPISLEVVDSSNDLAYVIEEDDIAVENKKICDPTDEENSLVHILIAKTGYDKVAITDSINVELAAFAPNSGKVGDVIDDLLHFYGYTWRMDVYDRIVLERWSYTNPVAAYTLDGKTIRREFKVQRIERECDGVRIKWWAIKVKNQALLYMADLPFGDDNLRSGYPVQPGYLWPDEANVSGSDVWFDYVDSSISQKIANGKVVANSDYTQIVLTKNHTLDVKVDDGLVQDDEPIYRNKRAKIAYRNPTEAALKIWYCDIYGDVVYRGIEHVAQKKVGAGENVKEIDAPYIVTEAAAKAAASMEASLYANPIRLNGKSTLTIPIGAIVNCQDPYIGLTQAYAKLVERSYDIVTKVWSYKMVSIKPIAVDATIRQSRVLTSAPKTKGETVAQQVLSISTFSIIAPAAISRSSSSAYTPARVLISAKRKLSGYSPTPYAGRFVIYSSVDGEEFSVAYTSAEDEDSVLFEPVSGSVYKRFKINLFGQGGFDSLLDTVYVSVVSDGGDAGRWPTDTNIKTYFNFDSYAGGAATIAADKGSLSLVVTGGSSVDGVAEKALRLSSAYSGTISGALPAVARANEWTIAGWIRFNAALSSVYACVLGSGQTDGSRGIYTNASGNIFMVGRTGTTNTYVRDITNLVPIGEWVHCAICWDGTNLHCYIQGDLIATLTPTQTYDWETTDAWLNTPAVYAGSGTAGRQDVSYDCVYTFARCLASEEVRALYSFIVPGSQGPAGNDLTIPLTIVNAEWSNGALIKKSGIDSAWNAGGYSTDKFNALQISARPLFVTGSKAFGLSTAPGSFDPTLLRFSAYIGSTGTLTFRRLSEVLYTGSTISVGDSIRITYDGRYARLFYQGVEVYKYQEADLILSPTVCMYSAGNGFRDVAYGALNERTYYPYYLGAKTSVSGLSGAHRNNCFLWLGTTGAYTIDGASVTLTKGHVYRFVESWEETTNSEYLALVNADAMEYSRTSGTIVYAAAAWIYNLFANQVDVSGGLSVYYPTTAISSPVAGNTKITIQSGAIHFYKYITGSGWSSVGYMRPDYYNNYGLFLNDLDLIMYGGKIQCLGGGISIFEPIRATTLTAGSTIYQMIKTYVDTGYESIGAGSTISDANNNLRVIAGILVYATSIILAGTSEDGDTDNIVLTANTTATYKCSIVLI